MKQTNVRVCVCQCVLVHSIPNHQSNKLNQPGNCWTADGIVEMSQANQLYADAPEPPEDSLCCFDGTTVMRFFGDLFAIWSATVPDWRHHFFHSSPRQGFWFCLHNRRLYRFQVLHTLINCSRANFVRIYSKSIIIASKTLFMVPFVEFSN